MTTKLKTQKSIIQCNYNLDYTIVSIIGDLLNYFSKKSGGYSYRGAEEGLRITDLSKNIQLLGIDPSKIFIISSDSVNITKFKEESMYELTTLFDKLGINTITRLAWKNYIDLKISNPLDQHPSKKLKLVKGVFVTESVDDIIGVIEVSKTSKRNNNSIPVDLDLSIKKDIPISNIEDEMQKIEAILLDNTKLTSLLQ